MVFITTSAYKRPFTPEDLEVIEKKMQELAKADIACRALLSCLETRRSPTLKVLVKAF
jgi:threonyl-tRNA synthetase